MFGRKTKRVPMLVIDKGTGVRIVKGKELMKDLVVIEKAKGSNIDIREVEVSK